MNENKEEEKHWYRITFSAKLSEDDIAAMKDVFYDAMEESMDIAECADLDISDEED